ncbi:MAG: hypothetical protein ACR2NF_08435 [Pirellulales bacterium]
MAPPPLLPLSRTAVDTTDRREQREQEKHGAGHHPNRMEPPHPNDEITPEHECWDRCVNEASYKKVDWPADAPRESRQGLDGHQGSRW